MKDIWILLLCVMLGGCAGYRLSHVHGTIAGNSLTTPYGPASGNLVYDATTCIGLFGGKCPNGSPSNAVILK